MNKEEGLPLIVRMCNIVQAFPHVNQALELYFLLNSESDLWGCGKPTTLPVQVCETDYLRDKGSIETLSLQITHGHNRVISFAEPIKSAPNPVMFSASYADLQNLFFRSPQSLNPILEEAVRVIDVGGELDLWRNGNVFSRQKALDVILSRLSEAYAHFREKNDKPSPEPTIFVMKDGRRRSKFDLSIPVVEELNPISNLRQTLQSPSVRPRLSRSLRRRLPRSLGSGRSLPSVPAPFSERGHLETPRSSTILHAYPKTPSMPRRAPQLVPYRVALWSLPPSVVEMVDSLDLPNSNPASAVLVEELDFESEFAEEEDNQQNFPPACTLSYDKIKVLWSTTELRKEKSSCSTMTRCLCTHHVKDPFEVQDFYVRILEALGDVAMARGSCPMCSISIHTRSKKPLVRFTEEVSRAEETDHDWSDFQFRGMLFEMFPDNWVAVENKVYYNKNLALSSGAKNALDLACRTRRKGITSPSFSVEEVCCSNLLRAWPLYEMAISQSHRKQAHSAAVRYLDVAYGQLFRHQFKEQFREENPILTRIMVSAAQMIPGGNCRLDDTDRTMPHSRSESHVVGCFVIYKSPGTRVLAEMLRTWDSIPWNGDVASYLTSAFQEEFTHGALNYYFNSKRSKAIKMETWQGVPHVTRLLQRDDQGNKANEGCAKDWYRMHSTIINQSQLARKE